MITEPCNGEGAEVKHPTVDLVPEPEVKEESVTRQEKLEASAMKRSELQGGASTTKGRNHWGQVYWKRPHLPADGPSWARFIDKPPE